MEKRKPISTSSEWTFELLSQYDKEISRLAKDFGLDTYPNQIEIISSAQMMESYASVGMPVNYHHWSFGKQFVNIEKNYKHGHIGLAYEIVINSNPSVTYLMEENSMMMQALVIAHASYGHNSYFKNNYLFKTWTNPDSIIDYLLFAKKYIAECEEKYGIDAVEETLDACHALMGYGVDRYKKPVKLSLREEEIRQKRRQEYLQTQVNDLWRTLPTTQTEKKENIERRFPEEPEENLLYFIEKNAPLLETWQRELVRIVRKIAQYFYPQRQTKMMNEGWACFWHYTLLNALYDEGLVTDEFMLEFMQTHTNVIYQMSFDNERYRGLNPYALGYKMMTDIRRICENPTQEDTQWFPDLANSDWLTSLDFAMRNFKDESFIAQYLSPKLIREMRLFSIIDDDSQEDLIVSGIHDETGYQYLRQKLSQQYDLTHLEPNIEVYNVNTRGDRSLTLRHAQHDRKPLSKTSTDKVMKYLHRLWGFDVTLKSVDVDEKTQATFQCPKPVPVTPINDPALPRSDFDADAKKKDVK